MQRSRGIKAVGLFVVLACAALVVVQSAAAYRAPSRVEHRQIVAAIKHLMLTQDCASTETCNPRMFVPPGGAVDCAHEEREPRLRLPQVLLVW